MSGLHIKRVDRLVMLSVIGSVLMVWLVLSGFDAITQLMHQLGSLGKNGYTLSNAFAYVIVTFPRRLYEMFPFAALIGGLLGLGGLAATGELTALRAAGMSRLRIAMSAVGVVTALIIGVAIMGETAAPWGDQKAQSMQLRLRNGNVGATSSGTWARDGASFINARGTMLTNRDGINSVELADVRIFTMTPGGELSRFEWARSAQHNGKQWVLEDVRDSTIDSTGVHTTLHRTQLWLTGLNPQVLAQSIILPQYLSMRDLRRNIRYRAANGEAPGVYAVAFWGRALYPLSVLVLTLCAMPFAFGVLRSGGLGKRMFIGMLLAISWYFLQKAMVNFGTVYGMPPLLANLLPILLLATAAWAYFRRSG